MLVFLAPGQGSQAVGMLASWLDVADAQEQLVRWSELIDLDLIELGTTAAADVIRATDLAQPLLTAAALLSGRMLLHENTPDFVCGHSIGELAAAALAGVLTDDEAIVLARGRGEAMAAATALHPTGMTAVLGGEIDKDAVQAAGLEIATVNAAGQTVLGGTVEALDAFAVPPGIRLRRLEVAGAFHTSHMAPARERFAQLVASLTPKDAHCAVIANADGAVLHDGQQIVERLVGQLTGPVRFDRCIATMVEVGVSTGIELAPGGTLTGLMRRAAPSVTVTPIKSAADLRVDA